MKALKWILMCSVGIALLIGGIYLGSGSFFPWNKRMTEEEGQVMLEKVRETIKLITLEADFSELYNYKDYLGYDFSPFRKKAILRVQAKASIGFDLEKVTLEVLPEKGQIIVRDMPKAEILSLEHDLDYYDLQEGVFNSFSERDLSDLNQNAKKFIRTKAEESDLLERGNDRLGDLYRTLDFMVKGAGWELVISPGAKISPPLN